MVRFRRRTAGILLFVFAIAPGCAPLPKTYTAAGVVTYQDGQPMAGGVVQFKSADDPLMRVTGEIQKDGSFTLQTQKDGAREAGAPTGEYRVVVMPPPEEVVIDGRKIPHRGVPAITLAEIYTVAPQDNNTFRIVVPNR